MYSTDMNFNKRYAVFEENLPTSSYFSYVSHANKPEKRLNLRSKTFIYVSQSSTLKKFLYLYIICMYDYISGHINSSNNIYNNYNDHLLRL